MSQSFIICNFDKREFLNPNWFGQHNTLPGTSRPPDGPMVGLACLLALSGSGHYRTGPLYGRWAGDRIALVGDYYQGSVAGYEIDDMTFGRILDQEDGWVDVSEHLRSLIEGDWGVRFPPPLLDGTEARSLLQPDGRIIPAPTPSQAANPYDDEADAHQDLTC